MRILQRGDMQRIGDVEVAAVAPAAVRGFGINDRSLVLSLTYAGRRFLLTGDIEAPAEGFLVRESADNLHSTVIKVPHHGSSSSSTAAFVEAVRPELAVISAGFGNRYGFPAPRVLGRYAAIPSRVLRTDLDGAVEVRIDASGAARVRAWAQQNWTSLASIGAE
jgi:competence protein ComEC